MGMLWSSFINTLRAVFSDRSARVTMVGAVILYSFFYPAAYRLEVAAQLPIAVVDLDGSDSSRLLLRRMAALREVEIVSQPVDMVAAVAAMEAGRVEAIVQVPRDFERDILRGRSGQLMLLGDGAYLGRASSVLGGLAAATTAFAREAATAQAAFAGVPAAPPVQVVQRPLFNTREGYGSSIVPGVSALIVHQTLLIGIGLLLGSWRRQLRQRVRMPLSMLLGAALAFFLISVAGLLYYAGFTAWIQDYPRAGNLPGLLLVSVLFIAATVVFGMLIGSFFDNRERVFPYVAAVSIPLFFLAGLSWPSAMMPGWMVQSAQLLPIVPGINAMVRVNQMGASVAEVLPQLINLLILLVVYSALLAWRMRPTAGVALSVQVPAPLRGGDATDD